MSDTSIKAAQWGPQNSGNPVLDSVVNILCSRLMSLDRDDILNLHTSILAIALKEPGGLRATPETYQVVAGG